MKPNQLRFRHLAFLLALIAGPPACDDDASGAASDDNRTKGSGKQDAPSGSCADACGGIGSGACFCDDLCSEYGDCCTDVAEVCGLDQCALEPDAAPCPEGEVCLQGDCPLSCLGEPGCCAPNTCVPPPAACESSDDCAAGEFCSAPEACDAPGTCAPQPSDFNCLTVVTFYCGCDGQTRASMSSCIFDRFAHEGMCDSEDPPLECESTEDCPQGSFCGSPDGCESIGTCVEPDPEFDFPCLQAATPYCDCAGETKFSPTSCIEDRFAHVGMCEE